MKTTAIRMNGIEKHQFGPEHDVKVGDYVRSYDFPGLREDTYIEGTVVAVAPPVKGIAHPVYEIRAERIVDEGKDVTMDNARPLMIYPPVNGVPHSLGGYCYGVVKVARP